jgi:hypothetical protein
MQSTRNFSTPTRPTPERTPDTLVVLAAVALIGAGLIVAGCGCDPLVDNSTDAPAAPVTVVVSNATPGVYVNARDGATITIGDQNQIGINPDGDQDVP